MIYVREFFAQRLILFLAAVAISSGTVLLATPGGPGTGPSVAAGIVTVILVEYATHRFLLHEFPHWAPAMYEGHQAHHRAPNDIRFLFGPVRYDFAGYVVLSAAAWAVTRSLHLAAGYVCGAVVYQLYYQWKHYVSHRPIRPVTPWGKWMKKKHLLHHHLDDKAWYGVSNPVCDVLLGTDKPAAKPIRKTPPADRTIGRRT